MVRILRWAERRLKSLSMMRRPGSEPRLVRGIRRVFMRSRLARMGRLWPLVDSTARCDCIAWRLGNWRRSLYLFRSQVVKTCGVGDEEGFFTPLRRHECRRGTQECVRHGHIDGTDLLGCVR